MVFRSRFWFRRYARLIVPLPLIKFTHSANFTSQHIHHYIAGRHFHTTPPFASICLYSLICHFTLYLLRIIGGVILYATTEKLITRYRVCTFYSIYAFHLSPTCLHTLNICLKLLLFRVWCWLVSPRFAYMYHATYRTYWQPFWYWYILICI